MFRDLIERILHAIAQRGIFLLVVGRGVAHIAFQRRNLGRQVLVEKFDLLLDRRKFDQRHDGEDQTERTGNHSHKRENATGAIAVTRKGVHFLRD